MEQVLLSLVSGVIGSIIGAGVTVWATKKTITETAKLTEKAERKRADREENEHVEQAKTWVCAEILQMNEAVKVSRKRKLPTDAWDSTKMYLYWWNRDEQKALIELYNEVALFNSTVDFWMYGQNEIIRANHPGQLTASMQIVKPKLKRAIEVLKIAVLNDNTN